MPFRCENSKERKKNQWNDDKIEKRKKTNNSNTNKNNKMQNKWASERWNRTKNEKYTPKITIESRYHICEMLWHVCQCTVHTQTTHLIW